MADTSVIERMWLTVPQAAKHTGVSKTRIYEALRAGRLPGSKQGANSSAWRIYKNDLDAWMRGGPTEGLGAA